MFPHARNAAPNLVDQTNGSLLVPNTGNHEIASSKLGI